ncbi:hypothetical protein, partial [Bradyrhizobium sp.]|uniref:hypothetical protein n=1 Tax=Bradyrhizobium sp. TaxID=376 RepID=UPI002BC6AD89
NLSLASDLVAIHSPWNLRRFAPRNDKARAEMTRERFRTVCASTTIAATMHTKQHKEKQEWIWV